MTETIFLPIVMFCGGILDRIRWYMSGLAKKIVLYPDLSEKIKVL